MSEPNSKRKKRAKSCRVQTPMSRRALLRHAGQTAALAAGIGAVGWWAYSDAPIRRRVEEVLKIRDFRVPADALHAQMAIVRGQNVEQMAREALAQLGGLERFVQKGDRVLLKPNVGWDRQPEQAANTGPELVGAMTRLCIEAGASDVVVSDVSLNDPHRCFFRSGIEQAVQESGGTVRLPGTGDYLTTDMGGELLTHWPVNKYLHQADKVINLPIVKHHSLTGCTLAMKNWYGVIGGRRNQLHQDIHTSIVDLAAAVRPTLTVMDATRVLKHHGPTGGSLADVSIENTLIASLDEVALDAYSLRWLDVTPDQVPFLAMAEARGLGRVDWKALQPVERQLG
ncbi:MAG: DUF362 domain-containing protein [Magnetococcales bacterium]|nr:DUF362 domain-containing protein [Magnetococcales bacterium]